MQSHTIKTTLTFTPGFLQQLKRIAHERRHSMSRLVEEELSAILREREGHRRQKMYTAIKKWQRTGAPGITDASQSIDDTLYGNEGAWQGERAGEF